jgi:hypothetical protein
VPGARSKVGPAIALLVIPFGVTCNGAVSSDELAGGEHHASDTDLSSTGDGDPEVTLIDDLEHPDRRALWIESNDGTPGGTQQTDFEDDGSGMIAVHSLGSGFEDWGTTLTLSIAADEDNSYDLVYSGGVRFRAKGSGRVGVSASVKGVVGIDQGGSCIEGCYDSHRHDVTLTDEWEVYEIPWEGFSQAGWGTPVHLQAQDVLTLNWSVVAHDMPYEFWLDDIELTRTNRGIAAVLTEEQFEQIFPRRDEVYTYDRLVEAANGFPAFANTGTAVQRRREVAAFLANVGRETSGLRYTRELEPGTYCNLDWWYGCPAGAAHYYGRGAIQLSWNYNYKFAGDDLGVDLLDYPDVVATDPLLVWRTAMWFWQVTAPRAPLTPHDAIVEGEGFGKTIEIINGDLECRGRYPEAVGERINRYRSYCSMLGVDPGGNIGC